MDVYKTILNLADKRKKLRVAVLDDEQEAIELMVDFIKLTDGFELAFTTNNPREALTRLKKEAVHVLFLDMEMPEMHGMQFMPQLDFIKAINPLVADLQVVVCTAHEHFARESFDRKAADYLTKPVYFDRYLQAVHEVKRRLLPVGLNTLNQDNDCLLIYGYRGMEIARLDYKQIIYVEAQDDKTWLWINSTDYYETYEKMHHVLLRLPKSNFVQVHRSYAISLQHFKQLVGVKGKKEKQIVLAGTETAIPIGGKEKYPLFENWLGENAIRGKKVSKKDPRTNKEDHPE